MKLKHILMVLIAVSIFSATIAAAQTEEIISSQYPGILAGLGQRIVKITFDNGNIAIEERWPATQKFSLNANGGRTINIYYRYNGRCGSGTSNSYGYIIDSVDRTGTMQISCTVPEANREPALKAVALSYAYNGASITAIDLVYLNGVIYQNPGTPTPTPTPTVSPTSTPPGNEPPAKPIIIPPELSRLIEAIFKSIKTFLGLSIQGGALVKIPINEKYEPAIQLAFTPPDQASYTDGTYQTKYGEYFTTDKDFNVKYESGWVELKSSPYVVLASVTPTTPGKMYLVGVVMQQNYTYDHNSKTWKVTESVDKKEVQELNVLSPTAPPPTPEPQPNIITWLMNGIKNFISKIWSTS